MVKVAVFVITVLFLTSCQTTKKISYDTFDENELAGIKSLRANMAFLASDELEGRETGTRSEKVAAAFLISELQKYGVQPLPENGDYYQDIELKQIKFSKQSLFMMIDEKQDIILDLSYGENFTGSGRYYPALDTTLNLVFVGYGITAEEYNYDDYETVDVEGKLVLFVPGEPQNNDSSFFEGEERSRYASSWSKLENAKKHGALGAVYISAWEKRFGWESVTSYTEKGEMQLIDKPVKKSDRGLPAVVLRDSSLKSLLSDMPLRFAEIQAQRESKQPLPVFELNSRARISWSFDTTGTVQACNVVGVIEGNDPHLKNEYVLIGAHYDHEGTGPAGVYNGADDNASGTVAVLEAARMLAGAKENRRSVMIAFYTGEEKGLLGSEYLAGTIGKIDDLVTVINLDMVGRGATDTIYSIGSDKISTDLRHLVEEVDARTVDMYLDYKFDQPNEPMRLFYRSDQYNFAKNDIPVVFFFDDAMEDYHRVTDDAEKINYKKLHKVSFLAFRIALAVANRETSFHSDKLAGKQEM